MVQRILETNRREEIKQVFVWQIFDVDILRVDDANFN